MPPVGVPGWVRLAGRREWVGLAVLALACLLYAMDLTVLHLAVPSLSAQLQPSSAQLLWITDLDVHGRGVPGRHGTQGDRIGCRRLLAGGTAFGVVSLLAAWSTSPELLIAARALLGLPRRPWPPRRRPRRRWRCWLACSRSPAAAGRHRVWITSFSAGGRSGHWLAGCCWSAGSGGRCSCRRCR